MPYKCCVPGCSGNYSDDKRVHIFALAKDEQLSKQWVRAIPRDNFQPTKNTRVCEQHFSKGSIKFFNTYFDEKSGKTVDIPLQRPTLLTGSVPTIFPNCPSYLSKPDNNRKSREAKSIIQEEQNLQKALTESIQEYETYKKLTTFKNFDEFKQIFESWILPEKWHKIVSNLNEVLLFKIRRSPGPIITYSINIDSELKLHTSHIFI